MLKPREAILTLAREIPLFSTEQAARYFSQNGSPSKRASELLVKLEKEGLLEGKRREIGKSKLWRLSQTGRKYLKVNRAPLPFNSPKAEHVLQIGSYFQELLDSGRLAYFIYEPKDEFEAGGTKYYSPDAFFLLKNPYQSYLLEVQTSPISSSRWAKKWAIASAFFDTEAFTLASWQRGKVKLRPKILVVSTQEPETVAAGSSLNLTIAREISSIL